MGNRSEGDVVAPTPCLSSEGNLKTMPDDKDFQEKVQRIGGLVHELDSIVDPAARASAKELVQLLLDLHATGLERIMEMVAKNDDRGQQIIDDLGSDPLVSSLLVLYGLHPLDLESRVARAVDKVRPQVRKHDGVLNLVSIENGSVRLQLQLNGHGCGSTVKTVKAMVEDALYEAAPDMTELSIDGTEETPGASGFVPLSKLSSAVSIGNMNGGS